jgi:hypothetical protein
MWYLWWTVYTVSIALPVFLFLLFLQLGCVIKSFGRFSIDRLGYFSIYIYMYVCMYVLFLPGAKAVGNGCSSLSLSLSLPYGAIVLGFSLRPGFRPDMLLPSTITTTSGCPCHATCARVRWFFPHPFPPRSSPPTIPRDGGADSTRDCALVTPRWTPSLG